MIQITEKRPWGEFQILLETPTYKVKRLVVHPDHRLSYQRHNQRSEHWFIASGHGLATIDDVQISLNEGSSIDIPARTKHRIANDGLNDLIIIEVQTGSYFGEDDIERFSDDYQRS